MTIEKIKKELNNHIGKNATIKYDLGRNKYEEYDVVIKELYNHVFIVKLKNEELKSFSYSDVITKTIKIKY
jgi:uncharacterized protein Veg